MTFTEALEVAGQIASALEAAHAGGIVHRDIKPENVMLRRDGLVKVLDFGLAKLTESTPDPEPTHIDVRGLLNSQVKTNPSAMMGTPNYMSPEQAQGLAVDARIDIFSLGIVLYEMLTGKPPFAGETASEVIAAILQDESAHLALCLPTCRTSWNLSLKRRFVKVAKNAIKRSTIYCLICATSKANWISKANSNARHPLIEPTKLYAKPQFAQPCGDNENVKQGIALVTTTRPASRSGIFLS